MNVQSVLQPTLTAAREYAQDPNNKSFQDHFISMLWGFGATYDYMQIFIVIPF